MKIAFVLPYFADRFGGPVAVVKGTGRTLAGMGHEVSYWATASDGDRRELASVAGAHLYGTDWPHGWYRSRRLSRDLSGALPEADVSQIIGVWTYPARAGSRIARRSGTPYVIRPAGTLQPWALGNGRLRRWKKAAYFHLIARSLMDGAACVQAASTQEAEQMRLLGYKGPVTIIPNGVDLGALENSRDAADAYWPDLRDRPVVVFMSRLSPEKGLDLLIPAWAQITKSSPHKDALLVIAGPDFRGYQAVVKAMIEKHGVESSVLTTGMVRGEKKSALLHRADIFVLPSYSENFGVAVAEALACGRPVVTTTGTPWDQLPGVDAGRWVPPTVQDVREAIEELLTMPASRRDRMGSRGAALIREHYTWDRVAGKFLAVCDCILEGRPIPLHPEPKLVEAIAR